MRRRGIDTKNSQEAGTNADNAAAGKPSTWIADRKIKGLIFMGSDVTEAMNPEIAKKLKEMTGIELELQAVGHDGSQKALAAGLAAGDLPDFIGYYLNHSGRPEMEMINKAAREEMFHDLTPFCKIQISIKVYGRRVFAARYAVWRGVPAGIQRRRLYDAFEHSARGRL